MNLLPEENKILFKKNYLKRFLTIFGFFVFFVIVAGTVVLMPAYLWVLSYKNDLRQEAEVYSKKNAELVENAVVFEIKKLNNRLKLIENAGKEKKFNAVFKDILDKKNNGVKITFFSYEKGKESTGEDTVYLSGKAGTRDNLLLFESQLKKDLGENKIISPVSNLINEKDFDFSLTLRVENEK